MSESLTLSRRLWMIIIVILACSMLLGALLTLDYYEKVENAEANHQKLVALHLVMVAANRLSVERGPTNSLLGVESSRAGPARQKLAAARAASDEALDRLAPFGLVAEDLRALRTSLAQARAQADALAEVPFAQRRPSDIQNVIQAMFDVIAAAQPVVDGVLRDISADDGSAALAGSALVIRTLSDLREYAGRMGSSLIVPIATQAPIDAEHEDQFARAYGRVLELWQLVDLQTRLSPDPRVAAANASVRSRFFGDGMAFFQSILADAREGRYRVDAAGFTNRIVPTFKSLEDLRDSFTDATFAKIAAEGRRAKWLLLGIGAVTALTLVLECALLVVGEALMFRPLLVARGAILALAEGRTGAPFAAAGATGEMRSLFNALDTLRQRLIERERLDREKAALTAQLKLQADRDELTGLLNRGALERFVAATLEADTGPPRIGLILLDIDHFKSVNDRFGHVCGDHVLQQSARHLAAALRPGDVIARFGGEEFAVALLDPDPEALTEIAERLRLALQDATVTLSTGMRLQVTASFGLALARRAPGVWPRLVEAADQALYRAKAAGRNRVATGALWPQPEAAEAARSEPQSC